MDGSSLRGGGQYLSLKKKEVIFERQWLRLSQVLLDIRHILALILNRPVSKCRVALEMLLGKLKIVLWNLN